MMKRLGMWFVLLFITLGFALRALHMSDVPFHDWDEGIYATVASEMLENRSLITTFNQENWINKPPLSHALIALAFGLFGESETSARMIMVVFATFLMVLTYLTSKKILTHLCRKELDSLSGFEVSVAPILAVLALAQSPIIVERATQLNTDVMLGVFWLAYFYFRGSYWLQLAAITFGVWTKSLLGFYPVVFEILSVRKIRFDTRTLMSVAGLVVIPSLWFLFQYLRLGDEFVQVHLMDQLLKRVSSPIELHFGGRMYYPTLAWQSFGPILLLMGLGYIALVAEIFDVRKNTYRISNYFHRISQIWTSKYWWEWMTLLSPLPFFVFLIFVQSKISWYFASVAPLFVLIIPYLYVRLKGRTLRFAMLLFIVGFFLYRFVPTTYMAHFPDTTQDHIRIAKCVGTLPGEEFGFLVNAQERQNRNVLEAARLYTATSFIYGGSPSFVYYVDKKVHYFYKPDEFSRFFRENQHPVVVSKDDLALDETIQEQVGERTLVTTCSFGEWVVYK